MSDDVRDDESWITCPECGRIVQIVGIGLMRRIEPHPMPGWLDGRLFVANVPTRPRFWRVDCSMSDRRVREVLSDGSPL